MKAPVPEPWKAYSNEQDEIYYCNTVTGQIIYDHPLDEHFRKKFQEAKNAKLGIKQPAFLNKSEDPLIRAETEKKVKEQRVLLEQEFK